MDINYFEPIKKNKKQSNMLMAIVIGIILAAALALVLFSAIEIMDQNNNQHDLDEKNAQLEAEGFAKQKNRVSDLENNIASLEEKKKYVAVYEDYKKFIATGTTEMISYIQSQITENSLLTNLYISKYTITITAESSTIAEMAQFSYNIANCGHFQNVLLEAMPVEKKETENGVIVVYPYTIKAVIVGEDHEAANEQMNSENETEDEISSEEVAESEEN